MPAPVRRATRVAKARTAVNSIDMSEQARTITAQGNVLPDGRGLTFAAQPVTDEQQEAMREQGMTTGAPFAPGTPIKQSFADGTPPRQFDYQVGANIVARPRSNSTKSKMSFQTLRAVIDSYDVARMCIEHKQDDIRSMDWRLVAMDGHSGGDVDDAVALGRKFFNKPDGTTPFGSWLSMFLEDVFRFDAGAIWKQRTRAGQVIALEVVDGTTVAPLIDYRGRRPTGAAPAYVQWIQGVPGVWMNADSLIYQPYRAQPDSPYGYAPIEWLLLNANTDIRFQWHFLQYFTEGTLPAAFMMAPPDVSSAEQVAAFQALWDETMEGNQAMRRKVRWIPAGAKPEFHNNEAFDSQFPLYLMRKTCAAYKVTPNDLGFTEDVNRATGDTQVDVQFRIGTKPPTNYLEGMFSEVLQHDLGLPLKFEFDTGQDKEDRLQEAQTWQVWVEMGAASPDEPREKILGLPVDPQNPTPRFVLSQRAGAIPLKSIIEIAGPIDAETAAPTAGSVHLLEDDELAPDVAPSGTKSQPNDTRAVREKNAAGKGVDVAANNSTEATANNSTEGAANAAPVTKAAAASELRTFVRYAKGRVEKSDGWRDFTFGIADDETSQMLNAAGRIDPAEGARLGEVLVRRLTGS